MAETELHRVLMTDLIQTLQHWYADHPRVYVGGNLLLYYVEGDKRRHVSPDVFVAHGVGKHLRDYYLLWEERHPPRTVIELTSSSTRREDTVKKHELYRDVLKVREYFLFDPREEYLRPSLQGYRLRGGVYESIRMVEGRLPSVTLKLHLERSGQHMRLYDPSTQSWLPTTDERTDQALQRAEEEKRRAEEEKRRAEEEKQRAEDAERAQAKLAQENEALRQQLEQLLRGRQNGR